MERSQCPWLWRGSLGLVREHTALEKTLQVAHEQKYGWDEGALQKWRAIAKRSIGVIL